jgi:hypothetical protein
MLSDWHVRELPVVLMGHRFLLFVITLGAVGFLLTLGYSVRRIFTDFGPATGLVSAASIAFGCVALGFLLDNRQR